MTLQGERVGRNVRPLHIYGMLDLSTMQILNQKKWLQQFSAGMCLLFQSEGFLCQVGESLTQCGS